MTWCGWYDARILSTKEALKHDFIHHCWSLSLHFLTQKSALQRNEIWPYWGLFIMFQSLIFTNAWGLIWILNINWRKHFHFAGSCYIFFYSPFFAVTGVDSIHKNLMRNFSEIFKFLKSITIEFLSKLTCVWSIFKFVHTTDHKGMKCFGTDFDEVVHPELLTWDTIYLWLASNLGISTLLAQNWSLNWKLRLLCTC